MSDDLFSVLAAIGILALVYRWFTTSPLSSANGANSAGSITALQRRALNLPRAQVDRLLAMFPQLTENEVRYALVVTRGGVEAVAERVLLRGGLEPPPPNFFPPSNSTPAPSPSDSTPSPNNATPNTTGTLTPNHSLIARFRLEPYKLDQDSALSENRSWNWEDCQAEMAKNSGEATTAGNSSVTLQDRKARMVLESRWWLLQRLRKGKAPARLN